jgi:outer membrane protein W
MKTRKLAIAGLVAFCLLVFPAWAEKGDMQVGFGFSYSMPTDDLATGSQTADLDDAFGYQAAFEYMVTNLIGVEPAVGATNYDVTISETGIPDLELGEIDLLAVTADLNFHLFRQTSVDLFVGPTIGYAFWGDLETDVFPQNFPTEDEFIYGLNLGADVPFGDSKWAFSGTLDYLVTDVSLEGGTSADLGVDPLQVKIGVTYNF